jgi:predicted RNase H-like nuclease (RuvC/YqgF family)
MPGISRTWLVGVAVAALVLLAMAFTVVRLSQQLDELRVERDIQVSGFEREREDLRGRLAALQEQLESERAKRAFLEATLERVRRTERAAGSVPPETPAVHAADAAPAAPR